jgi:hypothetical protein
VARGLTRSVCFHAQATACESWCILLSEGYLFYAEGCPCTSISSLVHSPLGFRGVKSAGDWPCVYCQLREQPVGALCITEAVPATVNCCRSLLLCHNTVRHVLPSLSACAVLQDLVKVGLGGVFGCTATVCCQAPSGTCGITTTQNLVAERLSWCLVHIQHQGQDHFVDDKAICCTICAGLLVCLLAFLSLEGE